MKKKQRLDHVLVERGFYETVDQAKRAVMAGLVFTEEERLDKAGIQITLNTPLSVKERKTHKYVSRGGLKLEKALEQFDLNVKNKVIIDIGSSTGGFTDCALQKGAKLSYAVDVGYNQLAWKLRQDQRVVVMERTNFRHLRPEHLSEELPSFATIDVSFISLKLILPVLKTILVENSDVIALVKPQFEAERTDVGAKGIVKDKDVHKSVIEGIITFSENEGYTVSNLTYSPITGGYGNIEFLLHLKWLPSNEQACNNFSKSISEIIDEAHEKLLEEGK